MSRVPVLARNAVCHSSIAAMRSDRQSRSRKVVAPQKQADSQRELRRGLLGELLTREDQPLLDVVLALSFSSQANFTRAFRQGTGMTPGEYRRGFAHH
jgi:AraC family transcriptional regulator